MGRACVQLPPCGTLCKHSQLGVSMTVVPRSGTICKHSQLDVTSCQAAKWGP